MLGTSNSSMLASTDRNSKVPGVKSFGHRMVEIGSLVYLFWESMLRVYFHCHRHDNLGSRTCIWSQRTRSLYKRLVSIATIGIGTTFVFDFFFPRMH